MDFITRCYASSMRLFPDRPDVLVPGRWYYCEDGAQDIPYLHPFTSIGMCDRDVIRLETQPMLGEVYGSNTVVKGQVDPFGLPGNHFCGDQDAWQNGVPYAERGLLTDFLGRPLCCQPADQGCGGIAFGGLGKESALAVDVCQGGIAFGGYGVEPGYAEERSQGGIAFGGYGIESASASEVGQGGVAFGGYGVEPGYAAERGQGGVAFGGYGLEVGYTAERAQGGVAFGGQGQEAATVPSVLPPGVTIVGEYPLGWYSAEAGLGGIAVGGHGQEAAFTSTSLPPGVIIVGESPAGWLSLEVGFGGVAVGGQGAESAKASEEAQGGVAFGGQGAAESATISVSCGGCTSAPVRWTFTIAGYTGGAAALNGTWTLAYVSGCTWSQTVSGTTWQLQESGGLWILSGTFTGGNSAFHTTDAAWNCTAANTIPYGGGANDTGHPASVTINPA